MAMPPDQPSNADNQADFPAINGYEVLELIGHGGMASVWKTRQISSGRLMALKVLSEHFSRDPEDAKRFTSYLKLIIGLKHAGLAQVYDCGHTETTGYYFLATEYITGYSLGAWLRRSGRLLEADALTIAHFVADALRYAWNKSKLVHGNIKPEKIMIDNDGVTKVTDLGLTQATRFVSAYHPDDQPSPQSANMFQYMSPELASGQTAPDCRSDIYSLGATLYHMLTGKMPFGDDKPAIVRERQIKEMFEHPQAINPSLTAGTARLIWKMVAKAPGERYQKWEEALADITRLESGDQRESAAVAAAAAAPSPGASDKSVPPQADEPQPVTVIPQPGTKPSGSNRDTGKIVSKKKVTRALSAPIALPKLKKPDASFGKTARRSFYIALAFHGLLLLTAGIIVISRVLYNRETKFIGEPPPLKAFEPRKLEHKVKVQKRQRSSSRPSMTPRLVAMKESSFALPEIKIDSKSVKTSFSPKFTTVSGVGMGVGLGMGYGLGGFGQGVSAYDFFGIKGRADRVAILVDVSESMVEDIRGDEAGYQRVRAKINAVIDSFSEQALFNVIVFADAGSSCSTNLMIASMENKQKAKDWLAPFNARGNFGLSTGNLKQSNIGLRAVGGTTRLDLALTGAFEQGADTILIISDGLPRVKRELTDQQRADWDARIEQWEMENAGALKARNAMFAKQHRWQAEHSDAYTETKVWVPATKRKEGQPATEAHWFVQKNWGWHGGNLPALTPQPTPPENLLWWQFSDFIEHFTMLYKELYEKKGGKKAPVIHCIGYAIDEAGGDFMKGLARHFKGNYRLVGGKALTEEEVNKRTKRIATYPNTAQPKHIGFKTQGPNNNAPPNKNAP